jgi:hypothetical protein
MPTHHINFTYAAAAATPNPMQEQSAIHSLNASEPISVPKVTHDAISISSNDNISRLAELKSCLKSIHSERLSLQSDHHSLRADFQKLISGVLQHSKEIHAMQSDIPSPSSMTEYTHNTVFSNAPAFLS